MTQSKRPKAEESWQYYRSAFSRRSRLFPNLSIIEPLIDRICELGYSGRLYASSSLDNLVISVWPQPRDRRQTILVIPQEDQVEFRLYPQNGQVEVSTVAQNQAASVLDHLLPRLTAEVLSSSGAADGESDS